MRKEAARKRARKSHGADDPVPSMHFTISDCTAESKTRCGGVGNYTAKISVREGRF
jgi:hypothetical protein